MAFQFKQFAVHQDKTAMKIGTDGVLLGAWAQLPNHATTALDIGAGTGIISLMLAQRFPSLFIEAVEPHPDAHQQCVDNFEASHWGDRLFCYHAFAQELLEEEDLQYDVIISNPPYFEDRVSTPNDARDMARKNNTLPLQDLFIIAYKLLNHNGKLFLILPSDQLDEVHTLTAHFKMSLHRVTHVRGHKDAAIKRVLIAVSNSDDSIKTLEEELIIEKSRHVYTDDYIALTRDFYVKM